jgi:hypothetical protein
MIGVPLQMEQHEVAQNVVAVPRVMRLATFVAAPGITFAQQAVVLNVVGAGQLPVCEEIVNQQERNDLPAKQHDQCQAENRRNSVRLQNRVAVVPDRLPAQCQAFFFHLPGSSESAWYFATRELVNTLPHTGAGRVAGCRYVLVMSAVVFH